ncbi:MAG: sensor histidine kinase [Bacteroidota bacterium]
MNQKDFSDIFSQWSDEISTSLFNNRSLCVALISSEGELLFSNTAMAQIFSGTPADSLLNPSFERLLSLKSEKPLIYEGFMTIGDYSSVNTSIFVQVYRKQEELLIIGGMDVNQLMVQNETLHHLNQEINNLQRRLIKEKNNLENTLDKLNKANEEQKELIATKDKLFSIIAHDLKNPFGALMGISELLVSNVDKYPPERVKEFVQNIHETSSHTYALLENLLEWSRLQTGKLSPRPQKIRPSSVIQEVISLTQENAHSKKIELQTEILTDDHVYADPNMLQTIIRNLVTNALKFTYEGGKVTVGTSDNGDHLRFRVADTGFGIESKHLEELFNVDCKLSKTGTAEEKGTGLGLLLCKEFVEANQGEIWVESELSKGSTFQFTIPLYQGDD